MNESTSDAGIAVDGRRLWNSLMEMARIGATDRGGVCRLAATELDREARDLFSRWCADAGCSVRTDAIGNLFARRPGRDPDRLPIAAGSHLDSQPTGGRFDGVYGVLAAVEVIRSLNDRGVETEAPIEICVWTNEEGSRFPPAMLGSGVYAGAFDLEYGYSRRDHDGVCLRSALETIGYRGELAPGHQDFAAFFELHIEQGPVLENAGNSVGIVTGVQGIRWYDLRIRGAEGHAGTTPMELRKDALAAATALAERVYAIATDRSPDGRATIGELTVSPGSRNTIPGDVALTVDLRHPDSGELAAMDDALRRAVTDAAESRGVGIELDHIWTSEPVDFAPECIEAVRRGAALFGYPAMDIVSGAGHDAVYVSRIAPVGMIFIPCEGGLSHNEAEYATPEDVEHGANVLLHAVLQHAEAAANAATLADDP